MSKKNRTHETNTQQDEPSLDDQDLDAVSGGILSTGHTTGVHTGAQTNADDFKRKPSRDRGGKIIWADIDGI